MSKRSDLEEQRRGLRLRLKVRESNSDWKAVGELAQQLARVDRDLAALPPAPEPVVNILSRPTVTG